MPQPIEIDQIRELIDAGAQLVEVLPPAEFEEERLAGAINIPLKQMTEGRVFAAARNSSAGDFAPNFAPNRHAHAGRVASKHDR